MKITLVTGNWAKIAQAKEVLEPLGIKVSNIKMDTIEIQADSVEEVAAYSAKWASNELKTNVVKNDTGISIEALKGFPSAYTHYVSDTIDVDGILKLMKGIEYGKEPVVFSSITKGTIAKRKSGKHGWSWDFIFIPEGQTKTFANFPDSKRFKLWNDTGYKQLIDYLRKNKLI